MTCSCLRGVSRWFTPLASGPSSPELSQSESDTARKSSMFTFTFSTSFTTWTAQSYMDLARKISHFDNTTEYATWACHC